VPAKNEILAKDIVDAEGIHTVTSRVFAVQHAIATQTAPDL